MNEERLKTLGTLAKLWDRLPDLTLGQLLTLSAQDELNILTDKELIQKTAAFVKMVEEQRK